MEKKPNAQSTKASPEPTGAAPNSSGAAGGEQVNPQQQNAYDRVVLAGLKIFYDQSTHAGIVNMLRNGEPSEALANTMTNIMLQLDQKSGGKIPEEVILPAAAELLDELAQLAGKSGVFQPDERILGNAMQRMVMSLAEQYGATPEEVQQLMQSVPKEEVQKMVSQQAQYAGGNAQAQPPQQPAAQPAMGV